jgi:hypothetical protein
MAKLSGILNVAAMGSSTQLDPDNGGLHDEVKTVTIRTFSSHEAAQLATSNLEAHGIECWMNADDCGGMYGRESSAEYDNNFDGKADEWWTFSDDGTDTLQKDNDFNGIPDEFCVFKNRIIQQMDMKPNGSKFTTTREIFQNGVLTEILRGGDSNGNFKEDVHYDPFLNPIPINFNPISSNAPTAFQLLSPSK